MLVILCFLVVLVRVVEVWFVVLIMGKSVNFEVVDVCLRFLCCLVVVDCRCGLKCIEVWLLIRL